MRKAELAWRRALAEQTLADVSAAVKRGAPEIEETVRAWYARN
jgi:hypothetical protein